MAKGKGKNSNGHLRARLDYLHKAAAYLQSTAISQQQTQRGGDEAVVRDERVDSSQKVVPMPMDHDATVAATEESMGAINQSHQAKSNNLLNTSRVYMSQLRGISLKTQQRLPQELKRSICKRCETLLVLGANCTQEIRNVSREGKKPWADVRVVRCTTCSTEKRFPQTDRRSKKLGERRKEQEQKQKQPET